MQDRKQIRLLQIGTNIIIEGGGDTTMPSLKNAHPISIICILCSVCIFSFFVAVHNTKQGGSLVDFLLLTC